MAPSSVVVTIEKANGLSVVEVNDSSSSPFTDKQKSGNAKVFTWVLLLKAHRALGCIPWLARTSCNTFASVKKRITNSNINDEEPKYGGRLYRFIKIFLVVSVAALVVEILAYFNQWHLSLVHPSEVQDIVQWSYMAWQSFRVDYIAPVIGMLSKFCVVLFMIQSVDRFMLGVGCFWIKFKKLKPEVVGEPCDVENASSFPMVLVQIPMRNC